MKRPQGFDGRTPRRPRRTPAPEPRGGADAPAAGADPLGAVRAPAPAGAAGPSLRYGGRDAADRVTTEPIVVVEPSVTIPVGGAVRAPGAAAPEVEPGPAAATADHTGDRPADAKSARRALAAAERERRRYEKQEVRRFTKRSRRRRLTWWIAGGAVAAVTVGIVAGAYSPLMALREVRVEGASRIPADSIAAAFDGQLGTPLTLITGEQVHAALADFRLIETYSVETIPPGTLVVRIVERTPVGVIEAKGGGLELVDAAGVVIDRPAERPDGQPLIEVDGGVGSEGFKAVAAVVRSLPAEVRSQLVGASAETPDDVRLELAGGVPVVWGGANDSGLKADVLATLMKAAPPDTVPGYDVSSPEAPITG
ncbi:FtsQ-type POTRA domain-containing protein [Agromyces sp. S2-1-8]|uniref:FtsQ-type POTRA domain-containing protein n=1 Tax=unclassified Agromyces TaxID=2639701 RepID=UPI001E2DDA6B|nr:FtsQ-type POTRA domain-containing protein [Agromyces sp. S2-1-8]MCD5347353.1 FtsQ-type POTRA domain-containing protein [Agromyces sp. S2-1-8]